MTKSRAPADRRAAKPPQTGFGDSLGWRATSGRSWCVLTSLALAALLASASPAAACSVAPEVLERPGGLAVWDPESGAVWAVDVTEKRLRSDCELANPAYFDGSRILWEEEGDWHLLDLASSTRSVVATDPWWGGRAQHQLGLAGSTIVLAENGIRTVSLDTGDEEVLVDGLDGSVRAVNGPLVAVQDGDAVSVFDALSRQWLVEDMPVPDGGFVVAVHEPLVVVNARGEAWALDWDTQEAHLVPFDDFWPFGHSLVTNGQELFAGHQGQVLRWSVGRTEPERLESPFDVPPRSAWGPYLFFADYGRPYNGTGDSFDPPHDSSEAPGIPSSVVALVLLAASPLHRRWT